MAQKWINTQPPQTDKPYMVRGVRFVNHRAEADVTPGVASYFAMIGIKPDTSTMAAETAETPEPETKPARSGQKR